MQQIYAMEISILYQGRHQPSVPCYHSAYFRIARNSIGIGYPLKEAVGPITLNMSAVSRHFSLGHSGNTSSMSFIGIERIERPIRGGDFQKKIFSRKSKWIFNLGTRSSKELNLRQDIRYQCCIIGLS